MPVQIWTPGQVLTAAELTTVTNLLPYPVVTTVNVNPAVAGNLYRCQPSGAGTITLTLPAPTAGLLVGAKFDAAFGAGTVVIQHHSSEVIYLPGGARGVTSVTLSTPDAALVLVADGTNWHAVCYNPSPPSSHVKLRLYNGGADVVGYGSGAEVPWDNVIYDEAHDLTGTGDAALTGFVKAPVKGYYAVSYGILYTNTATGGVQFSLCNGGSSDLNQGGGAIGYVTTAGQGVWVGASNTVRLNAGDEVGVLFVTGPSGTSTFRIDPRYTYFNVDFRDWWY